METLIAQCSVEGCDKPRRPQGVKCYTHRGKPVVGNCATCGVKFTTSSARKYCSQECFKATRSITLRRCTCGKRISFYAASCMKCSAVLRRGNVPGNKGELVKIICEICGTMVERIPSQAVGARYCSKACSDDARRLVTGEGHPLFKVKPIIECGFCGKAFTVKPSEVKLRRFCSPTCHGSASIRKQGGRSSSIEETVSKYLTSKNVSHERQVRVAQFLADFRIGNLIVEVDGTYWHSIPKVKARDIRKNAAVAEAGYAMLRLTEAEVRAENFTSLDAALLVCSSVSDSGE